MSIPESVRLYREKKEARREYSRRKQVESKYGVSYETLEDMLDKQGGVCGICGVELTFHPKATACVDHCHSTGDVRGILCRKCNAAIGALGDTASSVAKAVAYLQKTALREI